MAPSPKNVVTLDYGLGAPVGFLGVRYMRDVSKISVGALVGYGLSGIQLGAAVDLPVASFEYRKRAYRIYLEGSYSLGLQTKERPDVDRGSDDDLRFPKGAYHWLQAGLGMRSRFRSGFTVHLGFGLTYLADHPPADGRESGFYFITFPVRRGFLRGAWSQGGFGWAF